MNNLDKQGLINSNSGLRRTAIDPNIVFSVAQYRLQQLLCEARLINYE
jgi:hypothetical protein